MEPALFTASLEGHLEVAGAHVARPLGESEVKALLARLPKSHIRVFFAPSARPGAEPEKMHKLELRDAYVESDGSLTIQHKKTLGRNREAKLFRVRISELCDGPGHVVNVELWVANERGRFDFLRDVTSPVLTDLENKTLTIEDTHTKNSVPERTFLYRLRFQS